MQITAKFYELKSFEEIELDLHLHKLKTRVSGNNSYQEIKRKMNKLSAANQFSLGNFMKDLRRIIAESDCDKSEKDSEESDSPIHIPKKLSKFLKLNP